MDETKAILYNLQVEVEELDDGGDYRYLATSPELPGLVVAGDELEEVLSLVPQVAAALIASMKAAGDPLPETLQGVPALPFVFHVAVPA
jgi:predicted RNase H-like HicB family nuclease